MDIKQLYSVNDLLGVKVFGRFGQGYGKSCSYAHWLARKKMGVSDFQKGG
jgi:hypothetical protein